jgi:hypothetical protein
MALLNLLWVPALVWVAFLKEWGLIVFDIIILFCGSQVGFALLPKIIPASIAANTENKVLRWACTAIGFLYTDFIMAIWGSWTVCKVLSFVHSSALVIPALILAYGCSTGPWAFLASKERDSPAVIYSLFALCFATMMLLGLSLLIPMNLFIGILVLMIFMFPFTLITIITNKG